MTTNGTAPRAQTHLQKEEHAASHWRVDVDEQQRLTGQTIEFEDLLRPTYWSRNIDRLKVGDIIRVHKDGAFNCDLIVSWLGPHGVGVKVFGAIVGTPFYEELRSVQAAQREKNRAALAASIVPGETAP